MPRFFSAALLLLGVFASFPVDSSHGQIVPYRAFGNGAFYNPATGVYGGSGVGTHLGAHQFLGNVVTIPTAHPLIFDFVIAPGNPQETVGANGDALYFSGQGQVALIPLDATFTTFSAVWSGTFTVEGGTGRFAQAGPGNAPLQVIAVNDPFTFADPLWYFDWTLNGTIRLK